MQIDASGILADKSNERISVLDNACGLGVVTSLLYDLAGDKASQFDVYAGDITSGMVDASNEKFKAKNWPVSARILDMQESCVVA